MILKDASVVRPRLLEILSAVLELSSHQIKDDLSVDNCEMWDSIRHLRLVLAVEDAFAVTFDESEIGSLTSLSVLYSAIIARLPS